MSYVLESDFRMVYFTIGLATRMHFVRILSRLGFLHVCTTLFFEMIVGAIIFVLSLFFSSRYPTFSPWTVEIKKDTLDDTISTYKIDAPGLA